MPHYNLELLWLRRCARPLGDSNRVVALASFPLN